MKKMTAIIFIAISLFLVACGGGSSAEISVKVDGKDKNFLPKSTWAYHNVKTFSNTQNGKTEHSKASFTTMYLANYDLDTSKANISVNKQKIDKEEMVKVKIAFTGEKDTNQDTSVKVGEYIKDDDRFQNIDSVVIYYFADGKEKPKALKLSTIKGTLNITSVDGNNISGNIDVTDGESSVKGSFTAKGHKSVK